MMIILFDINLQLILFVKAIIKFELKDKKKYNQIMYNNRMGQRQTTKQEQAVDQNYANGTLFMAMSTLEQLEQAHSGKKQPK